VASRVSIRTGAPEDYGRRGVTNKTSDYLKHANDCRMLAKQAKVEEHKEMLVNMAASWEMRPRAGRGARKLRKAHTVRTMTAPDQGSGQL
jgi:hypothetical protein